MTNTDYKIGDLVLPWCWSGDIVTKTKIYIVDNKLEVKADKASYGKIKLQVFGNRFRKAYKNEKDRYNKDNPWL